MILLGQHEEKVLPNFKLVKDETGTRFLEATLDGRVARTKVSLYDWQLIVDGTEEQKKQVMHDLCMKVRKTFVRQMGKSVTVLCNTFG